MNGNIQEITPEYFTAVTGKTDDDINGGMVYKENSEYDDEEWYVIKDYKGSDIRVYRSEDVVDDIYNRGRSLDRYYLSYKIFENKTSPSDEFSGYAEYDFTYSSDNKFAIAVTEISENGCDRKVFYEAALAAEKLGK